MESHSFDAGSESPGAYVHLVFHDTNDQMVAKYEGYGLSSPRIDEEISISNVTIHEDVLEDPELPVEPVGDYEVIDIHRHYMTLLDEVDGESRPRDEPIVHITVTVEQIDDGKRGWSRS